MPDHTTSASASASTSDGRDGAAPQAPEEINPREHWARQLLKFGTVGVLNTCIELAVYNLLLLISAPRNLAVLTVYSTAGVVAALISSYILNSHWAFKASVHLEGTAGWRRRLLFSIQAGFNIGINDAVTVGATAALASIGAFPVVIDRNLAKFVAMFTSSMFSFLVLRYLVFSSGNLRSR